MVDGICEYLFAQLLSQPLRHLGARFVQAGFQLDCQCGRMNGLLPAIAFRSPSLDQLFCCKSVKRTRCGGSGHGHRIGQFPLPQTRPMQHGAKHECLWRRQRKRCECSRCTRSTGGQLGSMRNDAALVAFGIAQIGPVVVGVVFKGGGQARLLRRRRAAAQSRVPLEPLRDCWQRMPPSGRYPDRAAVRRKACRSRRMVESRPRRASLPTAWPARETATRVRVLRTSRHRTRRPDRNRGRW